MVYKMAMEYFIVKKKKKKTIKIKLNTLKDIKDTGRMVRNMVRMVNINLLLEMNTLGILRMISFMVKEHISIIFLRIVM